MINKLLYMIRVANALILLIHGCVKTVGVATYKKKTYKIKVKIKKY